MILGDKAIKTLIESGDLEINPLKEQQIQPASIDLTLGGELLIPKREEFYNFRKPMNYKKSHVRNFLGPGQFALATTREYIKLPKNLTGILYGRSSIGRLGLTVENASLIDPSFEGNITLELLNCTKTPMQLHEGMRICQMVLIKTIGVEHGYEERGKYLKQSGPTESRFYLEQGEF